ncbi:MAG: hypothetical protein RLZZ519_2520 [Bacteroidota bacterium]|jgi:hypothetical protein
MELSTLFLRLLVFSRSPFGFPNQGTIRIENASFARSEFADIGHDLDEQILL